jgi:nitrite reductase/ring-hydroxylating ferredoxin subunit
MSTTDTAPEAVCRLEDLPKGTLRLETVRRRKIALMRVDDDVYAFSSACPHKGAPLEEGCLHEGRREIICPWHRFRFDLTTGKSVTNPDLVALTFPVTIEDGMIYVSV